MSNDFVKVPLYVEKDGTKTFFLPDCRMGKGYEIGARGKDKERYIQSYWNALAKVRAMPNARFRRKNKKGVPGTVKCESDAFEEVSRSHIEQMIATLR